MLNKGHIEKGWVLNVGNANDSLWAIFLRPSTLTPDAAYNTCQGSSLEKLSRGRIVDCTPSLCWIEEQLEQ